jgi:undecaprenyl-diphosphatase
MAAGAGGPGQALLALDDRIFQAVNGRHAPWADALLGLVTDLGQGWVLALLLIAAIVALVPRACRRRAFGIAAAAMLSTSLASNLLKRLVARPRPLRHFDELAAAGSGFAVHVVGPALRHNSFPSAHSSAAFCAATVAVLLLGRRFAWTYAAAAAIAFSRVYVGAHFPLDAAGGALLGTAVGLLTGLPLRRRFPLAPPPD